MSNNYIRILRVIREMTQLSLANKVGFSRSKLSRIERGKNKVKPEDRVKLAKVLGISEDWLFPESNK